MPILIKSGRVITDSDDLIADIYCENEQITSIRESIDTHKLPENTTVIDAQGKYVFPGFIDPHVHIHLPFMGTNAIDDHDSATRAALAGGTTTIIEMICPGPNDQPIDACNEWMQLAKGSCATDYSFHMGVANFSTETKSQLSQIVKQYGIASFKVFLAYKGALNLDDSELFDLFNFARDLGVIVTAHCENADAIDAMQKQLISKDKTEPHWHGPSRPTAVEAMGMKQVATYSRLTGAHVYAVHTSCEEALRVASEERLLGANLWIESVVPHFLLDETYTAHKDFEGAKYIMSPPLRSRDNQSSLWNALQSRLVSTIGTDHAPFNFVGQKDLGKDNFTSIPNGIPSIQERVDLIHTYGVLTGKIDLHTFVRSCSTQAAKIFGMYPQKGTLKVGSDADIVIYNPSFKHTLSETTSESKVDYNAFEGWEVQGQSEVVIARGMIQARKGKFVGTPGRGKLIHRQPSHF